MKKATKNTPNSTLKLNSEVDSLSGNNESDAINVSKDGFVLFPLDVKETFQNSNNQIIQNSATSIADDFILFPLDINKIVTTTNNSAPITNQKTNKPKRQYVTKPNPQPINVNPQPANSPKPSPILVNRPTNKKLRNIFWFVVICLSIYTFKNKKTAESYGHFFTTTIQKFSNKFNNLVPIFINEADFKEFKKGKIMIHSPDLVTFENDVKKNNEFKGDSIILIGTTGRVKNQYYIDVNANYGYFDGNIQYEVYKYSDQKIYIELSDERYENWPNDSWYNVACFNYKRKTIYIQKNSISKEPLIELKYLRNNINDYQNNSIDSLFVLQSDYNKIKEVDRN
jgi:hypothetical protein